MSTSIDVEQARTLAFRMASAYTSRRLYASGNPTLQRSIEQLHSEIAHCFRSPTIDVLSVALLKEGLSVAGVPLLALPDAMLKLAGAMKLRGIEIVSVQRGATPAELETLLHLLTLDVAELTAVDLSRWLRDRGVTRIDVKHLELKGGEVVRSMRELYSNGRDALGQEFRRAVEKGTVELGAMAELAKTMLDLVLGSDVPLSTMLALRGRADFAYTHSMNVAMLASAQASSLGLDDATVRSIGIAALTHDLGKTAVPDSVLTKNGPLTAGEAQMLHRHPAEGARILLRTQGGGGLEAIVANEHHLPYSDDIHLGSQIVAIADAFDSVRSLRPFSDRASLRMALRFMLRNMRHRLNPYLLQRFCVMCGMYVVGDEVKLTTGEIARVVGTHAEMGARPIVEVTDTAQGRAPVGSVADLSLPHLSELGLEREDTLAFNDLTAAQVDALA